MTLLHGPFPHESEIVFHQSRWMRQSVFQLAPEPRIPPFHVSVHRDVRPQFRVEVVRRADVTVKNHYNSGPAFAEGLFMGRAKFHSAPIAFDKVRGQHH